MTCMAASGTVRYPRAASSSMRVVLPTPLPPDNTTTTIKFTPSGTQGDVTVDYLAERPDEIDASCAAVQSWASSKSTRRYRVSFAACRSW